MPQLRLHVNPDLFLCTPQSQMAEALFAIIHQDNAYLRQGIAWVSKDATLANIKQWLYHSNLLNQSGQRLTMMMLHKGQLVGSTGLVRIDKAQQMAEISYWIRQAAQGQGLVSQAVLTLIEYTFTEMPINRLEIRVPSQNTKSKALAKRLGFQYEGQLQKALQLNEQWHDLLIYRLLREEWNNKTLQTKM